MFWPFWPRKMCARDYRTTMKNGFVPTSMVFVYKCVFGSNSKNGNIELCKRMYEWIHRWSSSTNTHTLNILSFEKRNHIEPNMAKESIMNLPGSEAKSVY